MSNLYTNTSNIKGVVGLIVTTIAVSYAATNSTKIVEDTISLVKKGIEKTRSVVLHHGRQQYVVCARDFDGRLYDTGKRIWK